MDAFATHIRLRREGFLEGLGSDWSLRRTAGRLGVSPTYLSMLERGERKPNAEMIARVAAVLHEDVGVLMRLARRLPDGVESALAGRPTLLTAVRRLAFMEDAEIEAWLSAMDEIGS
jgi:transcriptional regulator with XRE-family HTH domain